jgi:hypothetical protein
MFSDIFRKRDDPLTQRADDLVPMARVAAIGRLDTLLEKFPSLRDKHEAHFDFLSIIVGVFFAVVLLKNMRLGEARERRLTQRVAKRLGEWNPRRGVQGFEHCTAFFTRTYAGLAPSYPDQEYLVTDIIGTWMVRDLFEHAPETEEERRLTRVVGLVTTRGFVD